MWAEKWSDKLLNYLANLNQKTENKAMFHPFLFLIQYSQHRIPIYRSSSRVEVKNYLKQITDSMKLSDVLFGTVLLW